MNKMNRITHWTFLFICGMAFSSLSAQKASMLVTTADGRLSLQQSRQAFVDKPMPDAHILTLQPGNTFQTIDGFGAAITYSAAYNLMKMSTADRHRLLVKTFSPKKGYGWSYVRVSIGCSDFSSTEYTCCDTPGLENFKLQSDETDYVIPILLEVLKINPRVRILGSPWTCPKWMKIKSKTDSKTPYDSWTDGHVNPRYYKEYAQYMRLWVQAMKKAGVPVFAITPQNEPLNPGNCASTIMEWDEETAFVRELAAEFKQNGLQTRIYLFDHNYNYDNKESQRGYPLKVYSQLGHFEGEELVVGSAYHNYGGHNSELTRIHEQAPDKGLLFTETSIGTWNRGRDLGRRLIADMVDVGLQTVNQWCTGVIVWNMMLDDRRGPNLDGGCQTCFGAIDIDSKDYRTMTLNSHYYVISHLAAVAQQGCVRISHGSTPEEIEASTFLNPDGSLAAVICNKSEHSVALSIPSGHKYLNLQLPARSVVSACWKDKNK